MTYLGCALRAVGKHTPSVAGNRVLRFRDALSDRYITAARPSGAIRGLGAATTSLRAAYAGAMAETVLVDTPYALVRADASVPCIIVQLHAFANREQFKDLMDAGLAYYEAHSQPTKRWGWIADTRQMSAIPQEVQQWLAEEWNLHAYQAGLREMSIISSTNIMGRLATQQYVQKAVAQSDTYVLEPVYYDSLESAKENVAKRCAALNTQPDN